MADVTIESIAIEITAAADSADKALERLSKNLETLRSVCASGLEGANKVAKGLQKIAAAAHDFDSVDGSKIQSVAAALQSLQNIGNAPDLTKFARSIQSIATAASTINSTDMSMFAANMQSFAAAVQPLSALSGMGDISRAINALKNLPKVADSLSRMNLGTFAQQMQQITTAIQPFVTQMQNLSGSFTNMPAPIQQAVAGIVNYNTSVNNANDRTRSFGKSLKLLNFTAMYFAVRKVVNVLGKFITSSNEYVENLNLFRVTMGETADEALDFANTVNKVMGIDVSQWIRSQGVFKQMTSGFGMVEEKANLVSKNLTQLGYDISSYFNISVEDSMQKLQAGLAGEIEPLRRLGYALDAATLQQVAHAHGIEMNINNMSQAQKAQLRYIAIMEQSTNAMGDMARTIESPANQLRILESRIETLKRAIGDSLMPVVSAALPYVTAFVQIVGEAFRGLAEFMGFELPEFDYSDVMTKQNEDIASSFDDATKASKEFKGTLASIDQLNIIGSKSEKGAGTGNNFGADLDLQLPSYDFLGNLKEETSEAYKTLKDFLGKIAPVAKAIAGVLATMFIIKKTSDLVNAVKNIADAFKALNSTMIGKIATGITAGVGAFILLKNTVKGLVTGNGSIWGLVSAISAVVAVAGTFLALGNPLGAALTVIGVGLGAIAGYVDGIKQAAEDRAMERIAESFEKGVTPISDVADALERVATDLTSSEQDYLNRKESLQSISDNAKNVGDNINTMLSELKGMEEISPDVTNKLKKAFEELAEASKQYIKESNNNFKLYILANQDMLKAQGFNVSSMVEIINQGTQNAENKIESLSARAKELADQKLSIGLSSSELVELENINTQLLKMSGVEIDFGVDVSKAKNVLESISSIKFEDPQTAADSMKRAFDTASTAYSTLETAKSEMLSDVERLSITGDLSTSEIETLRNAVESIFDSKKLELDQVFSTPLQSIISQAEKSGVSIASDIAQATTEGVEGSVNTFLGLGSVFNKGNL